MPSYNSREFYHPKYEIIIRFDIAQPGEHGYKGIDHYQIENPFTSHKRSRYLDLHGNVLHQGADKSHITMEMLKQNCCQKD